MHEVHSKISTTNVLIIYHFCTILYIIEHFHVTSSLLRIQRKSEISHHVGVQGGSRFCGDLSELKAILMMLLVCVESNKISLLHKLNSCSNTYLRSFLRILALVFCTRCTPRWRLSIKLRSHDKITL